MADENDLQELASGHIDLARADLRGAKLSGLDLRKRDFSGAHLEMADFSGANLSGSSLTEAHTSKMNAQDANMSGVQAPGTVIYEVNFKQSNLESANFERSHFSESDLTGADIRNANFSNAVFNDGTTFKDCIVNEHTRFDGALAMKSIARQEAFRYYLVERGVLRRREGSDNKAANAPIFATYFPTPPIYKNDIGTATFDYTNNDGIAIFGYAGQTFETKWSKSGSGSIYAYVNSPSVNGIAVVANGPSLNLIDSVPRALERLDYSSNFRTVRKGEVLVASNGHGGYAMIRVVQVNSKDHGDEFDELSVEYQIIAGSNEVFLTKDHIFSPSEASTTALQREINVRVKKLLIDLDAEISATEAVPPQPGIGHNNPPEETPIDRAEFNELAISLREITSEILLERPNLPEVKKIASALSDVTKKVLSWCLARLTTATDEFAKEAGKSLGNSNRLVTVWLAYSTEMGAISHSLMDFAARHLT